MVPAPFVFNCLPTRVIFGDGTLARVGDEIDRLGRERALVLTTPGHAAAGRRLAAELGPRAAGVFAGAAMHTPVAVTGEAIARLWRGRRRLRGLARRRLHHRARQGDRGAHRRRPGGGADHLCRARR